MKLTLPITIDDTDGVLVRHTLTEDQPEGHPVITFQDDQGKQVDIHLTRGRLKRLLKCIVAYFGAHRGDRPVSAEAMADDEAALDRRLAEMGLHY